MSYKAKAAQSKLDVVEEFSKLVKEYPIVGVCNLESLPAPQEQTIRSKLRDKVVIRMTKKRLMTRVFEKSDKKGIAKLNEYAGGMPALLFTKENPFSLFRTIKQNQSSAPAKAGQIAPKDIIVPAGPTGFAPGPVIGELGALGIKSKVDAGKIAILEDTVVVKEGDEISAPLASMLGRLNINPMSVGLDLVAVWENGDILTRSVLDIDEDKFMADLENAARWAFNLSCEAVYVTTDNRELLIQKAFRSAKGLGLECNIMADAIAEELLTKAERQASSLAASASYTPGAKVESKEEPAKPEEKEESKSEQQSEQSSDVHMNSKGVNVEPVQQEAEQPKEEKPAEQKEEADNAGVTPSSDVESKEPETKPAETTEKPAEPEKPAETPADNKSQSTDQKVAGLVQKTKDNDEGNTPSAADIVENS